MKNLSFRQTAGRCLLNPWCVFFLLLFVSLILRLPSLWWDVWHCDETQFAGYANTLLAGGLPYIDSVDTKPLGMYWFYAVIFSVFGKNNMVAVHAVTIVWVALTAQVCYRIAINAFQNKSIGLLAAIFYCVFTTASHPAFIATAITTVMALPLSVSICFLTERRQDKENLFVFLSGVTFVVLLFLLVLQPIFNKEISWSRSIRHSLVFVIGGAVVGAAFVGYLASLGVIHEFVFWSFRGSQAYMAATSGLEGIWYNLSRNGGPVLVPALILWIAVAARLVILVGQIVRKKIEYSGELLIFCWLLFTFVPVSISRRFCDHYFIQLYAPLCIIAAAAIVFVLKECDERKWISLKKTVIGFVIAGTLLPAATCFVLRVYADQTMPWFDSENPKIYKPMGQYIKDRTSENDTIFVWGYATPVYYYANRGSASRFLWCDWITGRIAGSPRARRKNFDTSAHATPGSLQVLLSDLEKNRPVYFVDTAAGRYHGYGKYPLSKYGELNAYVQTHYHFEAQVKRAVIYRKNDEELL